MKNIYLCIFFFVAQTVSAQIQFGPAVNHSYEAYTATISGTGTIYYTVDGTEPTLNSPSAINQVYIPVAQNLVLKAKLKNGNDPFSNVFTRSYYIGELPQKTVFFKAPPTWTSVCSYMNYIQPEFMVDFWGPGVNMTSACDGWFKDTYGFYLASVTFNNCIQYGPNHQEINITTADTVFYDYSLGPITDPPACLLGVGDSSKKVTMVKVFPNPVQEFLTIDSEKIFNSFEIVDGSGKSLGSKKFTTSKINVSALSPGSYYMKLKSNDENSVVVRFVKR